jgi:hypothetical protein
MFPPGVGATITAPILALPDQGNLSRFCAHAAKAASLRCCRANRQKQFRLAISPRGKVDCEGNTLQRGDFDLTFL